MWIKHDMIAGIIGADWTASSGDLCWLIISEMHLCLGRIIQGSARSSSFHRLSVTLLYSFLPFVYCIRAFLCFLSATAFVLGARGPQTLVRWTSDGVGSQEGRAYEFYKAFFSPPCCSFFCWTRSEHIK